MTDIASDLADKIMALVNSKPRSPSKDELVAVLRPAITAIVAQPLWTSRHVDDGFRNARVRVPVQSDGPPINTEMLVCYGTADASVPSDEPLEVKWSSMRDSTDWLEWLAKSAKTDTTP
jgi:hypothetical protein